jgi:hypothetical protein
LVASAGIIPFAIILTLKQKTGSFVIGKSSNLAIRIPKQLHSVLSIVKNYLNNSQPCPFPIQPVN